MKPTISLDTREWTRAAKQLKVESSRTITKFINDQAYNVALLAIDETKRAEAAKIAAALGQVSSQAKLAVTNKRGRVIFRKEKLRIHADVVNTLAARIIGAMWDRSAFKAKQAAKLEGKSLVEQIKIFIGWRVSSVNFIVSGWLPAIRKLSAVVYKKARGTKGSFRGVKQFGADKGTATPAKFSLRSVITATIENTALKTTSDLAGGNPMPVATEGLQRALDISAKDMMQELAERLQKDADKVNAR